MRRTMMPWYEGHVGSADIAQRSKSDEANIASASAEPQGEICYELNREIQNLPPNFPK